MGVGIVTLRWLGDPDPIEQGNGVVAGLACAHALVQAQGLADLVANGLHGVQCRHRLLKDHADAVAAHRAPPAVGLANQAVAVKQCAAAHLRRFGQQTHQRHGGDGFSAA
ncbi:hypothetical protein D3C72_1545740 [compost metagenome]